MIIDAASISVSERRYSAPAMIGGTMSQDGLRHYLNRAEDARMLATGAASPAIRHIHLEMARNYDRLAEDARKAVANPSDTQ